MAMELRRFRMDDEPWQLAQRRAELTGTTMSDVLREAVERYVAGTALDQQPDDTAYVVRYRERRSARAKVDPWNFSAPLPEAEARSMFKQIKRTMPAHQVQLVRRADYVVEQV